jgi:hypothetical protein
VVWALDDEEPEVRRDPPAHSVQGNCPQAAQTSGHAHLGEVSDFFRGLDQVLAQIERKRRFLIASIPSSSTTSKGRETF